MITSKRMHRVAGLALGGMLMTAPGMARAEQRVPGGTQVMLAFNQEVNSKTAKPGDKVALRVNTDVVVGGKTLIKLDSAAEGTIVSVKKPGIFGKKAELKMSLSHVMDVTGARVPLDPYNSGQRFGKTGPGAAGAGLLVLGPVGLVGGAFIKGKEITIAKGTRIQATVAGDTGKKSETPKSKK